MFKILKKKIKTEKSFWRNTVENKKAISTSFVNSEIAPIKTLRNQNEPNLSIDRFENERSE